MQHSEIIKVQEELEFLHTSTGDLALFTELDTNKPRRSGAGFSIGPLGSSPLAHPSILEKRPEREQHA
jgi:hypothetical protein